jgi:hypothetical protein
VTVDVEIGEKTIVVAVVTVVVTLVVAVDVVDTVKDKVEICRKSEQNCVGSEMASRTTIRTSTRRHSTLIIMLSEFSVLVSEAVMMAGSTNPKRHNKNRIVFFSLANQQRPRRTFGLKCYYITWQSIRYLYDINAPLS